MQKKSRPLRGLLFLRSVAFCCVLYGYLCQASCAAGLCRNTAIGLCVCRAALLLRHGVSHSSLRAGPQRLLPASLLFSCFGLWHFRPAQRDWSVSFLHLAGLKTTVSPVRCGLYFLQPHQSHTRCGRAFFEWPKTKPFVQPQVALALCAGKKHKAVWLGPGNHGLKQG